MTEAKTIPYNIQKDVMEQLKLKPKTIRDVRKFDRKRVEKETQYVINQDTEVDWISNSYGHQCKYVKSQGSFDIIYNINTILTKSAKKMIADYKKNIGD